MTTQAEMMERLCPIISSGAYQMNCVGRRCNAFYSRPNYEYWAENGKAQAMGQGLKRFHRDDEGEEITKLLAEGWVRVNPTYTDTYLHRETESSAWCDAMPKELECTGVG